MTQETPTLGMIINRIMGSIGQKLESEFKESNLQLTSAQFGILTAISMRDDMVLQDLATWFNKDKSSIFRQLEPLERQRYIVKIADADDKRRKVLVLTRQGGEVLKTAQSIEKTLMKKITSGISNKEMKAFELILAKIDQQARR